MTDPKTSAVLAPPRQLAMAFDSARLRGMSAVERRTAVTMLATLLAEAATPGTGDGDDER